MALSFLDGTSPDCVFLPAVNVFFALTSDLLSLFGAIFTTLGVAFYWTMHNVALLAKQAEALGGTSDNVGRVIDLVGRVVEMFPWWIPCKAMKRKQANETACKRRWTRYDVT